MKKNWAAIVGYSWAKPNSVCKKEQPLLCQPESFIVQQWWFSKLWFSLLILVHFSSNFSKMCVLFWKIKFSLKKKKKALKVNAENQNLRNIFIFFLLKLFIKRSLSLWTSYSTAPFKIILSERRKSIRLF